MSKAKDKILHSEVVFQGRFLKVTRDQVETSGGHISHREYINHPGAAVVLPVLDNGDILLVKQYRHAMKSFFYELPAGKRDLNEDPIKTAHRELKEETGFTTHQMKFMTIIHPVIGYANEEMFLYIATDLKSGPSSLDPGEELEVTQFSSEVLKQMVKNGEITDVKTMVGLFWYWNFIEQPLSSNL